MSNVKCNDWDSDVPQVVRDSNGRAIGVLQPCISKAALASSPGIQGWSKPDGKAVTQMYDGDAVASFAKAWEQRYRRSYPYAQGDKV